MVPARCHLRFNIWYQFLKLIITNKRAVTPDTFCDSLIRDLVVMAIINSLAPSKKQSPGSDKWRPPVIQNNTEHRHLLWNDILKFFDIFVALKKKSLLFFLQDILAKGLSGSLLHYLFSFLSVWHVMDFFSYYTCPVYDVVFLMMFSFCILLSNLRCCLFLGPIYNIVFLYSFV